MFLNDKSVLITGADGFIGSHLTECLIEKGCKVKAFVCYNSFNSWGWLDTLPKNKIEQIEIFSGDIRDPNGVNSAAKNINIIFHLAALVGIPFSYHSPDSYIDTNIRGTLNILQAARNHAVERVIVTSTSEVYGTAQYVPIDEKHPVQPQSPYSATKIGADSIAESFYRSFDLPVTIARPFNTYGPRQSARAVIPTIITQILNGEENLKLGATSPTRDLNFVKDVCKGFIALAESGRTVGKAVNIGSGEEISIGNLAELIAELMGARIKISMEDHRLRPEKSEVNRLLANNKLIRELTGWKPDHTLKQGLGKTIEWFRDTENLKKYKWDIYNV